MLLRSIPYLPFCYSVFAQDAAPVKDTALHVLSLQQAIDIGIKNNLQVSQAELQLQTSRINAEQARNNVLPVINGSASQSVGFGRTLNTYDYTYTNQVSSGSYGINGSLNVFSGLQVQNSICQYKYAYAAGKLDLQQQKDNLTLDILLAYLQIISNKELLAIAREQAHTDSIQLDRLQVLNEEGALPLLSNLSDLKGKYADDKVNIAIATNNLESARIGLFELLNIPYQRNVTFEYDGIVIPLPDNAVNTDAVYRSALHSIPSVQSAMLKIRSFEKALSAAKGQYYPSLSIYGGVATSYYSLAYDQVATTVSPAQATPYYFFQDGHQVDILTTKQHYENQKLSFSNQFGSNKAASVGIQLTIPILNSLHARNNVKKAKADLANAQLNERSARLALQRQIEQAYQNSTAAYKQYISYIDEAAAYNESFRITSIRFNEGIVNADTYVLAKNNLDKANGNLIIAKYNYIFRAKVMDYYRGQLEL